MRSISLRSDGRALNRANHTIQIYRRSYAPRSSWWLVGIGVLIVVFAVRAGL